MALAEAVLGGADVRAAELLRQPDFRRFWTSRLAGTAASQMLLVALGWQMYDLTGSAWDLGLVGLAQFLPALIFALPAGHLVDRHDRRRLLALCLAVQFTVALVLAAGSAGGWIDRHGVLAVSVVLGLLRALQMPASQALLPQLVGVAQLPRALALSSTALQGAIVAGPAVGGLVYDAGAHAVGALLARGIGAGHGAGAALVYALAAFGYAVAVVAVWRVASRSAERTREPASWGGLIAGLHFIVARPVVLGAMSLDLFAVLLGGATALLPIYARDLLHTGPFGLGLLRAAPAAGAFGMSILLAHRPVQRHAGRWLFAAVALYGLTMIGFGLATALWWAMAMLAIGGAADMVSVVVRQTLVQLETPDDMRGRVSAVNSVFIGASNQLGEFESGATAAWLGPVASVVAGGVGTLLVVALWVRAFPALARRDRLVLPAPDTSPHPVAP